jgi:hypothetical protein
MEKALEEEQAEAREQAMRAQRAAGPSSNMPPDVAAWLASAGLTVMPMQGMQGMGDTLAGQFDQAPAPASQLDRAPTRADADPNSADAARVGRGGGDSNAERTGVSTAVEAGPVPGSGEKPGEGTKSGEQEGVQTEEAPDNGGEETEPPKRTPRGR